MSFNPDPLNITGPTQPAPVQQPDNRVPSVNAAVANAPVGNDVMGLNYVTPPAKYVQPGINGPSGTFPF